MQMGLFGLDGCMTGYAYIVFPYIHAIRLLLLITWYTYSPRYRLILLFTRSFAHFCESVFITF